MKPFVTIRPAEIPGARFRGSVRPGALLFEGEIPVPPQDEQRLVLVAVDIRRSPWTTTVWIDGPICLRHRFLPVVGVPGRYGREPLCMWFEGDDPARRWVPEDGLSALLNRVQVHAFQESDCRAGWAWPGEEAPGSHPRPLQCRTCRGAGA